MAFPVGRPSLFRPSCWVVAPVPGIAKFGRSPTSVGRDEAGATSRFCVTRCEGRGYQVCAPAYPFGALLLSLRAEVRNEEVNSGRVGFNLVLGLGESMTFVRVYVVPDVHFTVPQSLDDLIAFGAGNPPVISPLDDEQWR